MIKSFVRGPGVKIVNEFYQTVQTSKLLYLFRVFRERFCTAITERFMIFNSQPQRLAANTLRRYAVA